MSSTYTIEDFMTASPHGIEPNEPVSVARTRMKELKVRHLPVRSGGKLLGILSERDLELVGAFSDGQLTHTKVADVMMPDPYSVRGSAILKDVVKEMTDRKIGSAVVVNAAGEVSGIFTEIDAMKALETFL